MTELFSPEAHRQNRQLSGFALTLDPIEVAAAGHNAVMGESKWMNKNLWVAEILEDQSNAVLQEWRHRKETRIPIPESVLLFRNAMLDARIFTSEIASKHPDLSLDRLLQIASHPRSIETLAAFAAHAATTSRSMLKTGDPFYRLDLFERFIKASPEAQDINPVHHCPEVSINNGRAVPSPHFKRFAPWASSVALHSMSQFIPPQPALEPVEQSA